MIRGFLFQSDVGFGSNGTPGRLHRMICQGLRLNVRRFCCSAIKQQTAGWFAAAVLSAQNSGMKTIAPLCCLLITAFVSAQEDRAQHLWDMERLSHSPKVEWGQTQGRLQSLLYEGEPFNGKPTQVFAWLGRPDSSEFGPGPYPGVVLVHGGGGRAFAEWAQHWADRGYIAIAMDTAGCDMNGKPLANGGPAQSHESKFRSFAAGQEREMWTYHAVSDVILAHSLIRSLPECDRNRTALTGISWGGYLTCITAGVDLRFKVAVPVYGCGFLSDNSAWSEKILPGMEPDSLRRWQLLFDPGRHLGRTQCPIMFLNGTNDFAYPLDSHRKTVEQMSPDLATVSIQLRLKHGHIWTFGVVDAFIDSHINNGPPLAQVGEIRVRKGVASAAILNGVSGIRSVKLLYTPDTGPWQKRKWMQTDGVFDRATGHLTAELPQERPLTFLLQATDSQGFQTSSSHFHLHADVDESNASLVPAPKLEQDFYDWYRRHADALRLKREIDPRTVLIGDSITHMWGGRPLQKDRQVGQDSWTDIFGTSAINLGFGWDRTQNVLWRIDHGELDGISPESVVINIGTNNLAGTKNHRRSEPREIANAVKLIVRRVRQKLPQAKIFVMGIFPRGQTADHPLRSLVRRTNALLPELLKDDGVSLIDLHDKFVQDDGSISKDVMPDYLHPGARAYRIWADALAPHVAP